MQFVVKKNYVQLESWYDQFKNNKFNRIKSQWHFYAAVKFFIICVLVSVSGRLYCCEYGGNVWSIENKDLVSVNTNSKPRKSTIHNGFAVSIIKLERTIIEWLEQKYPHASVCANACNHFKVHQCIVTDYQAHKQRNSLNKQSDKQKSIEITVCRMLKIYCCWDFKRYHCLTFLSD